MTRRRALRAAIASPGRRAAVDPIASLSRDFVAGQSLTGWSTYKPDAIDSDDVVPGTGLVLRATGGGGGDYLADPDADASFWFSPSNADQRSGFLRYCVVDSTAFDVRARIRVRAGDGSSAVPATIGEWRYCVLAIHDPDRASYLRYLHVGLGSEGGAAVVGWETKVTRTDATAGGSVFPTAAASVDADVRIVRSGGGQVFTVSYRALSSGEPLESDTGWTVLYTIDWSDGEDAGDDFPACPQETDAGLPSAVHVGFSVYSNATSVDLTGIVEAVRVRATG